MAPQTFSLTRQSSRWLWRSAGGSILAAVVGISAILLAQAPGADEVRVSSRPYLPPPAHSVRVQTNLVEVGVVVRDASGRPVAGLKSEDFEIFDEGKPRTIASFSVETSTHTRAAVSAPGPPGLPGGTPAGTSGDTAARPVPPPSASSPRFVALYFDDIHTIPGDLRHAQLAAQRFVREALQPDDRVAIFTTSSAQSLDFTNDAPKLLEAIGKLTSHPRITESGMATCPRISPYQAYLIVERYDKQAFDSAWHESVICNCPADDSMSPYAGTGTYELGLELHCPDQQLISVKAQAVQTWNQARSVSQSTLATIEGVVDYLAKMPGSHMLLVTSPGFLAGTLESEQDKIIAKALHAGVVINALDAKGLYAEAPGRPIDELLSTPGSLPPDIVTFETMAVGSRLVELDAPMANFTQSTGGLFFHNNNDLDYGFYLLGVVPEFSYVLGFYPDASAFNGKYHKLRVRLTGKSPSGVQARRGYFAPTSEEAGQPAPQSKFDQEVFAGDTLANIPVSVTQQSGRSNTGEPILWVEVHVDLRGLPFQQQSDRHVQKLTFVLALFDSKGEFVAGKEGEMNLALKENSFSQFSEKGIDAKMFLDAPPGAYQLRTVVQEAVKGNIAAATRSAEIH